jgi:hypothetical protein
MSWHVGRSSFPLIVSAFVSPFSLLHCGGGDAFRSPEAQASPASFALTMPSTGGTPTTVPVALVSPQVEVCVLTGTACGAVVAKLTAAWDPLRQRFIVNWHVQPNLDRTLTYRATMSLFNAPIAQSDVKIVPGGITVLSFKLLVSQVSSLPPSGGTVTVPASGAVLVTTDGAMSLLIPAGALAATTTISVAPTTTFPATNVVVGPVYQFEPQGLTFASPATVTLRNATPNLPAGAREKDLILTTSDGGTWDEIAGSRVDPLSHTVSGPVTHFSWLSDNLPVQSVVVSPATATVATGKTVQLTATPFFTGVSPPLVLTNRKVSWSSKNQNVATANADPSASDPTVGLYTGLVTAHTGGTATIEAVSGNAPPGTAIITVPVASHVCSLAQLLALEDARGNLSVDVVLDCDIDFATVNLGRSFLVQRLTARFDGAGHVLRNWHGFDPFVVVAEGGELRRTVFENVSIGNDWSTTFDPDDFAGHYWTAWGAPYNYFGGVVGVIRGGTVADVRVSGSIAQSGMVAFGGVSGYIGSTGVLKRTSSTAAVSGDGRIGGLVGDNDGIIAESYFAGSVSGGGGLVGEAWNGVIRNCYAGANESNSSGLIGYHHVNLILKDSFNASTMSGGGNAVSGNDGPGGNLYYSQADRAPGMSGATLVNASAFLDPASFNGAGVVKLTWSPQVWSLGSALPTHRGTIVPARPITVTQLSGTIPASGIVARVDSFDGTAYVTSDRGANGFPWAYAPGFSVDKAADGKWYVYAMNPYACGTLAPVTVRVFDSTNEPAIFNIQATVDGCF